METTIRAQVWAKTNGHCWYCGKMMNPWDDFTVDHMDPQKHGGGDEVENLVPACKGCNSRKNAKTVEGYREYLYEKRIIRFWGEQFLTTLPVATKEQEDEENRPAAYANSLSWYVSSCLNVGRHYSPGFTSTLLALLLQCLDHYYEDKDAIQGHWFFLLADLAAYTRQSVDEVFGQLMTMQAKELITITWDQGPRGGHCYTFDILALVEQSNHFQTEDRVNGNISYLP